MRQLRNFRSYTHIVLVWALLFVGYTSALPWIKAQGYQVVCSATSGAKLVDANGLDPSQAPSTSADCPLCAPVVPPSFYQPGKFVAFDAAPAVNKLFQAVFLLPDTSPPPPLRAPPAGLI